MEHALGHILGHTTSLINFKGLKSYNLHFIITIQLNQKSVTIK